MKMEQSVPKRRHIKFRRQGITQKKTYNILNTAKVWNQEYVREYTYKNPDSIAYNTPRPYGIVYCC
jgi:hypothetical protein